MASDTPAASPALSPGGGPDFLCVGARKAGTTWLYRFCEASPAFAMPEIKEINFFNSALFKRALGHEVAQAQVDAAVGRLPERDRAPALADPLGWYRGLFAGDGRRSGDVSPLYSVLRQPMVEKIRAEFPALKIVILLRNPLDRIMSDTAMRSVNQGVEFNDLDAEAQLDTLMSWYGPVLSMRDFIGRWRSVFGPSVGVFFLDEISAQPDRFAEKFCAFMGVEHQPGLAETVRNPNPGGTKKARLALKPAVSAKVMEIARADLDALSADVPTELLAKWKADVDRFASI